MDKILIQYPGDIQSFVLKMNMLLDEPDQRDKIDFDQTRDKVQAGETIEFLIEQFGDGFDSFLLREPLKTAFNNALCEISEVHNNRERRKWGVENNGLCLLLVYGMILMNEIDLLKAT